MIDALQTTPYRPDLSRADFGSRPMPSPEYPGSLRRPGTAYGLDRLFRPSNEPVPEPPIWAREITYDLPWAMGSGAQAQAAAMSAQPQPQEPDPFLVRPKVDLFGQFMQSGAAAPLGLAPGQQRGGFTKEGIATTPMNLANFSSWGREGLLALLTGPIGGYRYQQPEGGMFGVQPPQRENPDILDHFVNGINLVGDALWEPFEAATKWYRNSNNFNRGKSVRDLIATGRTTPFLIDGITSAFAANGWKFNDAEIRRQAELRHVDYASAMGEFYDLPRDVVLQIMAKPGMSDQELTKLTDDQALSVNPLVNTGLELGIQVALLATGVAELRGAGLIAKGVGGAARGLRAGRAGLGLTDEAFKAAEAARVLARPAGVGGRFGRALHGGEVAGRAGRAGWGARKALQLEAVNNLGGWTARGTEWAIKQAAGIMGNEALAAEMDRMLWETPLSQNPGWNLIHGATSHPIGAVKNLVHGRVDIGNPRSAGAVGQLDVRRGIVGAADDVTGAREPVSIRVGGVDVPLGRRQMRVVNTLRDMTLDDLHEQFFSKLGWSRERLETAFGEGNSYGHTVDDAKNGLLYATLQTVRDRQLGAGTYQGAATTTLLDRSIQFAKGHIEEGFDELKANMDGTSTSIIDTYKGRFWQRQDVPDSAIADLKARFADEYDPEMSLAEFVSWIGASKTINQAVSEGALREGTVPVLRRDVDRGFIGKFRAELAAAYKPGDVVSARHIDRLKRYGGLVETRGLGARLIRRRDAGKQRFTRSQLEDILRDIEKQDDLMLAAMADPRNPMNVPDTLDPERVPSAFETARVLGVSVDTARRLEEALALSPDELRKPPDDLTRIVAQETGDTLAALARDPERVWTKGLEWYQRQMDAATDAAGIRKTLLAFRDRVAQRLAARSPLALGDNALRDVTDVVDAIVAETLNPRDARWLAQHPSIARIDAEAVAARDLFVKEVESVLADEALSLPVQVIRGDTPLLWPDRWNTSQLDTLQAHIALAAKKANPGDAAFLGALDVHPLFKAEAMTRVLGDEIQSRDAGMLAAFTPDALQPLIERALGEGTPINAQTAAEAAQRAVAAGEKLSGLVDMARAVARRYESGSGAGITPQLLDLMGRLDQRPDPHGWRHLALRSEEDALAQQAFNNVLVNRPRIVGQVAAAEQEVAAAQAAVERLGRTAGGEVAFDYENPIARFRTKAQAVDAGRAHAEATGEAWRVRPDPTPGGARRYALYRGTRGEPTVAGPTTPAGTAAVVEPPSPAVAPTAALDTSAPVTVAPAAGPPGNAPLPRVDASTQRGGSVEAGREPLVIRTDSGWGVDVEDADLRVAWDDAARPYAAGEPGIEQVRQAENPISDARRDVTFVSRDAAGEVDGILKLDVDPDTSTVQSVFPIVKPEARRTGIASRLYDAAQGAGYDIRPVSGKTVSTEGRAFTDAYWSRRSTTPPVYGVERSYPNPRRLSERVPARMALREKADLTTSADEGYRRELQGRNRARQESDEQIAGMVKAPEHDLFLRTESGAEGTPIVGPDGMLLAGNGRVIAMRQWDSGQQAAYKAVLADRAHEFGLTREQVEAMTDPVLVREVPEEWMTAQHSGDLNPQGMSTSETGRVIAGEIMPGDIDQLRIGDETTLAKALQNVGNAEFVRRITGKLTPDAQRGIVSDGKLTAEGLRVVQAALLSRVLRDPIGNVVSNFVDAIEPDLAGPRQAIERSLGQLIEAEALTFLRPDGTRSRFDVTIGETLTRALSTLLDYKERGVDRRSINADWQTVPLVLDPAVVIERQLAEYLDGLVPGTPHGFRNQDEAVAFLRGYAKAVENGPDPSALGMFEAPQPPTITSLLNAGVEAANDLRASKAAGGMMPETDFLRRFPDSTSTVADTSHVYQSETLEPRVVKESAPVASVREEVDARAPGGWTAQGADPVQARLLDAARDIDTAMAEADALADAPFDPLWKRVTSTPFADLTPGEVLWLRGHAVAALLRVGDDGVAAARWNFTTWAESYSPGTLRRELETLRTQHGLDQPDGPTQVILPEAQRELPAGEFEAGTGFVPDTTAQQAAIAAAEASGEHVIVADPNPAVTHAVQDHIGAPRFMPGPAPRIFEFGEPNAQKLLEVAQGRKDRAMLELEAQRAKLAEMDTAAGEAPPPVIPDEMRGLWEAYVIGKEAAGPEHQRISEHIGVIPPATLGEVVDALESIEMGFLPEGMDDAAAQAFRDRLLMVAEAAAGRAETRRPTPEATSRSRSARAVSDAERLADPDAIGPEMQQVWRDLQRVVIDDPDAPRIEGWEPTVYELGFLPKNDRFGQTLSPRLVYDDFLSMLDEKVPGMADELLTGRKQAWSARIDAHRITESLGLVGSVARGVGKAGEMLFAARSEADIRANAINRFIDEVVGKPEDPLFQNARTKLFDEDAYAQARREARDIVATWYDEQLKQIAPYGGYATHRRVGLMDPTKLQEFAEARLKGSEYGALPLWASEYMRRGGAVVKGQRPNAFSDAWRMADNRMRATFRERGGSLGEWIDRLYEQGNARPVAGGGRKLTVMYHYVRFMADVRWLALEAIEAPFLTLSKEGPSALLAGNTRTYNPLKPKEFGKRKTEPVDLLFTGVEDAAKHRQEFSYWLAQSDPGSVTRSRERYLHAIVQKGQQTEFVKGMLDMARRDASLATTLREMGDTPQVWLERLDRDWTLGSYGTKPLPEGQAARVFQGFLDDGTINQVEFDEFVAAGHYTPHPAIEQALRESLGSPEVTAMLRRLQVINTQLWNDASSLIFGQADRSNFQRIANHPLLYWPVSYQIKATKWLAGILFDRAFGIDTGSTGAVVLQKIHDDHKRRLTSDPEYAKHFAAHGTLLFMAQMLLPVTPFDIGVSLSPFTRLALGAATGEYDTQAATAGVQQRDWRNAAAPEQPKPYSRNIFGFGPGYTGFTLLPRLFFEETKPGGYLENTPIGNVGEAIFPYTFRVKPNSAGRVGDRVTSGRSRSLIDQENLRITGPSPAVGGPEPQPQTVRYP